jgi:hypothetical protein
MGFDWVGPDLVFGGMTTLFIITGILSLRDAAAGELQRYSPLSGPACCIHLELQAQVHTSSWGIAQSEQLPVSGSSYYTHCKDPSRLCLVHKLCYHAPVRSYPAGFSNTGVLTVMMLYLVAEGVTQTGGLDLAMNFMLGKASTTFWAQVRTGYA